MLKCEKEEKTDKQYGKLIPEKKYLENEGTKLYIEPC
jgi:hypothetical protein